jgi:hypothetical protein
MGTWSGNFVLTWLISGPYTEGDAFETAFAPEKKGTSAKWVPLVKGIGRQSVDLLQAIGGSNRAVYLKTGVYCPEAKSVQLQMGSDDGIKVWINGKQAHANNVIRGMTTGEDKANAKLADEHGATLTSLCCRGEPVGHRGL